jgi:hypothetical protein
VNTLPLVLNVLPARSTAAGREAAWHQLTAEFEAFCRQYGHLLPAGLEHSYDIRRLEKPSPAFQVSCMYQVSRRTMSISTSTARN